MWGVKYKTWPGAKGGRRLSPHLCRVTPGPAGRLWRGWTGRAVPRAAVDRSALPLKRSAQAALWPSVQAAASGPGRRRASEHAGQEATRPRQGTVFWLQNWSALWWKLPPPQRSETAVPWMVVQARLPTEGRLLGASGQIPAPAPSRRAVLCLLHLNRNENSLEITSSTVRTAAWSHTKMATAGMT